MPIIFSLKATVCTGFAKCVPVGFEAKYDWHFVNVMYFLLALSTCSSPLNMVGKSGNAQQTFVVGMSQLVRLQVAEGLMINVPSCAAYLQLAERYAGRR